MYSYEKRKAAVQLYAHSGIDMLEDARSAASKVSDITLKPLDPSFKQYEKIDGLDLGDLLGIDTENALDAIGGDANSLFPLTVSRVNTDKIMKKFADAEEKIEEYVKHEGLENASSEDIFGGNRIIPQNFGLLPASLPYKTVTLIEKTSVVPEMFRESVTFSIRGAAPFDLNFAR